MTHHARYLAIIALICGALALCAYVLLGFFGRGPQIDPYVKRIRDARAAGEYQTVLTGYESIINDETKNADDKAIATASSAGAKFHLTGDMAHRVEDVKNLKSVIIDPTLLPQTRAVAINTLASQIQDSGRDPVVIEEIFKGSPFSDYYVVGFPEVSARKLFEWSYDIYPTPGAAVKIAKWYAEQFLYQRGKLSDEELAEHVAKAKEYLQLADAAAKRDTTSVFNDQGVMKSQYIIYRYYRAQTMGRLGTQGIEPYKGQVKQEWNDLIRLLQNSKNAIGFEDVFYARFTYASEMLGSTFNDPETAKEQADLLGQELNKLDRLDTHGFVRFLANTKAQNPNGTNWKAVIRLSEMSPDFKAIVDKIVAIVPVSTAKAVVSDNY